jgi:hypothetical protein
MKGPWAQIWQANEQHDCFGDTHMLKTFLKLNPHVCLLVCSEKFPCLTRLVDKFKTFSFFFLLCFFTIKGFYTLTVRERERERERERVQS